jgi:hypothetical protein
MQSTIFWDITPCSPLNVSWRFGGTYRPLSLTIPFSAQHTFTQFSCILLRAANTPLFRASQTPFLVSYWFARWSCGSPAVSICSTASQWELRPILPFPSCFLYNPKFLPRRLLGLPPAFTLVTCSAYLTLKMEALYSRRQYSWGNFLSSWLSEV